MPLGFGMGCIGGVWFVMPVDSRWFYVWCCFVLVLVCLFGVALRLWCLIVLYLLFKWWFCFMFVWIVFVTLLFSVAVC